MKTKILAILFFLFALSFSANQFGEGKKWKMNNQNALRYFDYSADTLATDDTLFIISGSDTSNRYFNCLEQLEEPRTYDTPLRSTPDSVITIYQAVSKDADDIGLIITHQWATRRNESTNVYTTTNVAADTVTITTGASTVQRFAHRYWPGSCLRQLYHLDAATDNVQIPFVLQYLQYPGD